MVTNKLFRVLGVSVRKPDQDDRAVSSRKRFNFGEPSMFPASVIVL